MPSRLASSHFRGHETYVIRDKPGNRGVRSAIASSNFGSRRSFLPSLPKPLFQTPSNHLSTNMIFWPARKILRAADRFVKSGLL